MRWPDCATPRWNIGAYGRWRNEVPTPLWAQGRENHLRKSAVKPISFTCLPLSGSLWLVCFIQKARLEVDSNHWHKDFQSFALTMLSYLSISVFSSVKWSNELFPFGRFGVTRPFFLSRTFGIAFVGLLFCQTKGDTVESEHRKRESTHTYTHTHYWQEYPTSLT